MTNNNVEVCICPNCKKPYPEISNSDPPKEGELCIICLISKLGNETRR